jgi:hypothetical protein
MPGLVATVVFAAAIVVFAHKPTNGWCHEVNATNRSDTARVVRALLFWRLNGFSSARKDVLRVFARSSRGGLGFV